MKVPDSSSKPAAVGASKPPEPPPALGKSNFAKLLKKPPAEGQAEMPPGPPPPPSSLQFGASRIDEAGQAGAPPLVEGLTHEITARLDSGKQEIQIRFDSKTLDGLEVEITRERGEISIRFEPKTERAHAVLAPGIDQLAQSLAANGVPVVSIQLRPPSSSASGGQHGGGQQQQKGQQRQR